MNINFDFEIFEMFKDQCYAQLPTMEAKILGLNNKEGYADRVNDLFRMFHNYKSTSEYLGLDTIATVVGKTEDVLGGLRNLEQLNDDGIVEWLLKIKDQFETWVDEMDLGVQSFSQCDPKLLDEISVTPEIPKPSEIVKGFNILYIDDNKNRSAIITKALEKTLKSVQHSESIDIIQSFEEGSAPDVILLNMSKENKAYIKVLTEKFPHTAIIAVFDKTSRGLILDLARQGISYVLTNPIKGADLKRELLSIAHSYFSKRRVLITNKKIYHFIQNLEPLPHTLMKIKDVCDDEESSIQDLVDAVKQDPIIVGLILNASANPIYGLRSDKGSIDNVIAIFGKKTVKAICFGMMSSYLGAMNLAPYGITEEDFSRVGSLRLALVNAWYKHVNQASLSTLSSTAILGNLGQLLMAKEIEKLGLTTEFSEALRDSDYAFKEVEEKFLHTNTSYVTSDILSFWQLPSEIIDSIRYSADISNAPMEIHPLAVANFIVYSLVDLRGNISQTLSDEILYVLAEEGLDPKPLEAALEHIQTLQPD